ncbi:DNA-binding helix-turn-helix protein [Anaerococcus hydrogenalis]|nr:DNA-binding helix-turn-helix protein [Anaerococcus hydrogenalis]
MTFGEILRSLRIERGITQDELATTVGVAKSTISMYESNQRRPGFEMMEAIADALNVDMNTLYGTSADANYFNDPEVAAIANQLKDNPRYRVLFEASRDLSKENIDFVIKMIENLPKGDEDFSE